MHNKTFNGLGLSFFLQFQEGEYGVLCAMCVQVSVRVCVCACVKEGEKRGRIVLTVRLETTNAKHCYGQSTINA